MPIPEERLYNRPKLNRWFACGSVLMMSSLIWLVWVDYDRPWHEHQRHYFFAKAALAHLSYLQAVTEDSTRKLEEARQRLADISELDEQVNGAERARLRAELAKAELAFKKADSPWSQLDQTIKVTSDAYERALGAYGPDHPRTKEAHAILLAQQAELAVRQKRKETAEDQKKALGRRLKNLNTDLVVAKKRVGELEKLVEGPKEKDRENRGLVGDPGKGLLAPLLERAPLVSEIINAPLLDFTAPKNTPSRYQVNQLVLPKIRQQLNYLETYTTDRCTTCHIAIDNPDFSQERLAKKFERSLPAVNEALKRLGHPPLDMPDPPQLGSGSPALRSGHVTEHWEQLSSSQRKDYFQALLHQFNAYLKTIGREPVHLEQPILAHPTLDLFVSLDSPHPMAKIGCTVCHAGNPQETDFVLASHSAPTHDVEDRWAEEYYTHNLGIPPVTFETVAHYWDRPMYIPEHTQAGCTKCHTEVSDIARFRGERVGERINLGRHLFVNLGCANCHDVDGLKDSRRVGPDLSYVRSKLTPAFLQQWVYFPRKFRASAQMPHFFLQENNRAESKNAYDPDPVFRTQTEVAAISKYLMAVSGDWEPLAKPADVIGDAERGRALFKKVGCLACHANVAEFGESWITHDLMHKDGLDAETAGHRYKGMTQEERVRYAVEHFVNERETFLRPDVARFDPDADYHTPTLTRFAPELSGIGSKVTAEWLYSWLSEPTHYFAGTKMPRLRLAPEEAADIAAYLMTLRNDRFVQEEFEMTPERQRMADELIFTLLSTQRSERASRAIIADEGGELTKMLTSLLTRSLGDERAETLVAGQSHDDRKLMFLGNKMIAHYGCYACHLIPGFENTSPPGTDLSKWAEKPIAQLDFAFYGTAFHDMREEKEDVFGHVYPLDADVLNYWSPGENPKEQITHTRGAFAKHKMLNPRIWDREKIKRPYDKLKMPNFYLDDEEATALTTFLLSRRSSLVEASARVDYENDLLGPIARGRNLTRELNCVGCHQIEDNVPTIQQFFRREIEGRLAFDETNAPPRLWGEGAKIQHSWLHRFFADVETLRPWLTVRMPSFNLTNEQRTTLVEYFAALSQSDSKQLDKWLAKVDEHIASVRKSSDDSSPDSDPAADWFRSDSLHLAATGLRRFGVERKLIRPFEVDLLQSPLERVRKGYAKLLDRTRFMQKLYDVEFPFVEPSRPLADQARFDRGMNLFTDMGCLKCHVLGEMLPGPAKTTDDFVQAYRLDSVRGEGEDAVAILNGVAYPVGSAIEGLTLISATNTFYDTGDIETKAVVEGPNPQGVVERVVLQAASAPNLALTHRRLRRAWVVAWMLQPALIQPGTKMPQNFAGGRSPFEGDPKYPGDGMDHVDWVVDTIYDAGVRGVRAPLVKAVVAAEEEKDEFDEDGGEDFDDD